MVKTFLRLLLPADFSNRLHLLLLIASVATYTIVGAGLLAPGAHVSRRTWRVIKALEQRDRKAAGRVRLTAPPLVR